MANNQASKSNQSIALLVPEPTPEPTHVVIRPFSGARQYQVGEQVDASGWQWADKLVAQRYLAPIGSTVANNVEAASQKSTDKKKEVSNAK
jgi:hypothetical protein